MSDRWALQDAVKRSGVQRAVFAASGPGVQADDDRPDGMSAPFAHIHQARCVGVPPEYDQISGPVELAPGIKISWASRPGTLTTACPGR